MGLNEIKLKYQSFSIFEKIILFNVLIFLSSFFFKSFLLDFFQLNSNFQTLILNPWTLLTYSFIHIGFLDIVFNMLILFYVSRLLVDLFNTTIPLKIYFYGIITGGIFFILFSSILSIDSVGFNLIGASAGVRALLIFLCVYMPNKQVKIAFWNIELRYIAYFILIVDILGAFGTNSGGYISHLGGDLLGLYFYSNLYSTSKTSFFSWESIKSYFSKKSSMKYYKNKNSNKSRLQNDASTQKRIDVILEKISKSGYENLSKDEKEFLFKVGKK
jgi:membrane associated rhomboid family serine protease